MNYTEPPRSLEYIRERCECDDCWEWKLSAKKGRLPRLFIRVRNEAGEVEYDQMFVRYLVYWHKHGRQPVVGKKHVLSMSCGNDLCVNPDHLRLTTRSEVSKKVASRGGYQTKVYRRKIAEASRRRSKLSDEAVAAIREAADAKAKDLAEQYGISEAYVHMLRRGEWRKPFEQVTPFTGLGARA